MTIVCTAVILVLVATAAGGLLRVRIARARGRTHALEAFRAQLGLPADRCRIVDVSWRESLTLALRPSQRLPRFEHVHRVPRHPSRLRRLP